MPVKGMVARFATVYAADCEFAAIFTMVNDCNVYKISINVHTPFQLRLALQLTQPGDVVAFEAAGAGREFKVTPESFINEHFNEEQRHAGVVI